MAKHSENFAAAAWDKNGGSCSVTSNAIIAPDGNQTADAITAITNTPVIQQQIAAPTAAPTAPRRYSHRARYFMPSEGAKIMRVLL